MTGPNGEREPHRLPFDLHPTARTVGLLSGTGRNPDTIVGPNPKTAGVPDKPHAHQPDFSDKYPWGGLSMLRPFLQGRFTPPNWATQDSDRKAEKTLSLQPHVDALLQRATDAQLRRGPEDGAVISLHIKAAIAAEIVYHTPVTDTKNPDLLTTRAFHGATAVNAFINAGEINDARTIAQAMAQDPLVPPTFKKSVAREIEPFGEIE